MNHYSDLPPHGYYERQNKMTNEKEDYPLNFYQAIEAAMGGAVIENEYGKTMEINEFGCVVWEDNSAVKVREYNTNRKYRIHTPAAKPKVKRAQYMVYPPKPHDAPWPTKEFLKDGVEFVKYYGSDNKFERLPETEREFDE